MLCCRALTTCKLWLLVCVCLIPTLDGSPFNDPRSFAALAMALETVGASAYIGASRLLENKDVLVEAAVSLLDSLFLTDVLRTRYSPFSALSRATPDGSVPRFLRALPGTAPSRPLSPPTVSSLSHVSLGKCEL
jgi:hypothetical protein